MRSKGWQVLIGLSEITTFVIGILIVAKVGPLGGCSEGLGITLASVGGAFCLIDLACGRLARRKSREHIESIRSNQTFKENERARIFREIEVVSPNGEGKYQLNLKVAMKNANLTNFPIYSQEESSNIQLEEKAILFYFKEPGNFQKDNIFMKDHFRDTALSECESSLFSCIAYGSCSYHYINEEA